MYAQPLDESFTLRTLGIDQGMRIAVPCQQPAKAGFGGEPRLAKDDRTRASALQQSGTTENEGPHHEFADLRAPDHEGAQMRRIERIGEASFRPGACHCQRSLPAQFADLAAELTWSAGRKEFFSAQPVPA